MYRTPLIYGLLNSLPGIFVGLLIYIFSIGNGYEEFIATIPLSSFTTGFIIWTYIITKKNRVGNGRIVLAGVLTGTLSHYITFLFLGLKCDIIHITTGGCLDSFGEKSGGFFDMLFLSIPLAFLSIIFLGWFTVTCAIIFGFILKKRENARIKSAESLKQINNLFNK